MVGPADRRLLRLGHELEVVHVGERATACTEGALPPGPLGIDDAGSLGTFGLGDEDPAGRGDGIAERLAGRSAGSDQGTGVATETLGLVRIDLGPDVETLAVAS